jgi:ferredoxin
MSQHALLTTCARAQVQSCVACGICTRVPPLNNMVFLHTLWPLWFSLCLLWVKIEPVGRQRQVALFALSAAGSAVLRKGGLWPSDAVTRAVVTAWLHPAVERVSKAGVKAVLKI